MDVAVTSDSSVDMNSHSSSSGTLVTTVKLAGNGSVISNSATLSGESTSLKSPGIIPLATGAASGISGEDQLSAEFSSTDALSAMNSTAYNPYQETTVECLDCSDIVLNDDNVVLSGVCSPDLLVGNIVNTNTNDS